MKQTFYPVHIRRDAVETVRRDAANTEIPVLQAIYGDAVAIDAEGAFVADRADITPADEYKRLCSRYGEEAVIGAYGTRFGAEREIGKLFQEGAALTATKGTGAKSDSADPFLQQKADVIIEAIPELSDEQLAGYFEAEKANKKPRKSVVEAFEAETKKRADEDAND